MSELDDLTEQEQLLIAADFAEHVLPLFEAQYPDDDRPRKAIEAARSFARGNITKKKMKAARDAAEDAGLDAAKSAAWPAAMAALQVPVGAAAWAAAGYPRAGADKAAWEAVWEAAGDAERAWQQERIDEVFAARAVTGA